MAEIVGGIATLLLLGAAILALCKRLNLPFTVILVLAGMGVRSLGNVFPQLHHGLQQLQISPDLIFYIFLPTLVFEASLHLDTRQLRRNLGAVVTLAVPGLLLSTALVGSIVALTTSMPLTTALLLGAILSATDPVAVIALFKEVGTPKRLTILVEGESLFNDATSVVLARILVGVVLAGSVSFSVVGSGVIQFVVLFAGGLGCGAALGLLASYALGRVESNPYIEITLTTVLAYFSFILAEEVLGLSGIMATIGAGLVLGDWGRTKISASVRNYLHHFWEYLAFVANALIFLMVGLRVELPALWQVSDLLTWVVLSMFVARAVVVFGLVPLAEQVHRQERTDIAYRMIMFWGGLRGAIALAIALSLPEFAYTDTIVSLVMGAVLFTLLVQGLTIKYLIQLLGLDRQSLADRLVWMDLELDSRQRALDRIDGVVESGLFSARIGSSLRQECQNVIGRLRQQRRELRQSELTNDQEKQLLLLRAFAVEAAHYQKLFNQGHLGEAAFRQLQLSLSVQVESIRYEGRVRSRLQHLRREQWYFWMADVLARIPGFGRLAERWRLSRVAVDYEEAWARYQSALQVLAKSEELTELADLPTDLAQYIRGQYRQWSAEAKTQLDQAAEQFPEFVNAMQERMARRLLLISQAESTEEQAAFGLLTDGAAEEHLALISQQLRRQRSYETAALKIGPTELLQKLPCLNDMPPEEFESLARRLNARTIVRDQEVIRQGETGNSMYFIARGVMRVVQRDAGGDEHELATLLAGDFFGEIALLHDVQRTATVKAVTPAMLYELRREAVAQAMTTYPGIRRALEDADRRRYGDL